jgi:hypothetical protein
MGRSPQLHERWTWPIGAWLLVEATTAAGTRRWWKRRRSVHRQAAPASSLGYCKLLHALTRPGEGALIDVLNADQRTTPQPKASRLPRASKKD